MIPKIIHLCWFSNESYPIEIRICLESWKRLLPDYEIKLWDYAAAKAIDCDFLHEALSDHRWAFAADVVRFYAVYKYGGVYMDSDIELFQRFDALLDTGDFITFCENDKPAEQEFGLQAAFFMGVKGNSFCKDMFQYYCRLHYRNADGSVMSTISPYIMLEVARRYGFASLDEKQELPGMTVYPTYLLAPNNHYPIRPNTIGVHRIYGSWRKRSLWRKLELRLKHLRTLIKYKWHAR